MSNVEQFIAKARQTLISAHALYEIADYDGACNRAYYAMYDMSLACLLSLGDNSIRPGKTHSGTITAFSQHFIKTELLPVEMGRMLKQAETIRYIADYTLESISFDTASDLLNNSERFVATLDVFLADYLA